MIYAIKTVMGDPVNTIVADEDFVIAYCDQHGYTYEALPEPAPVEPEATNTEVLNTLLGVTE